MDPSNPTNVAYSLPADAQAEQNRLNVQHYMLKTLVDGLYVVPDLVKKALDPTQRCQKCGVLDVGTGSGIWAVEMAKEFPSADVVGMDLVNPVNVTYVGCCPVASAPLLIYLGMRTSTGVVMLE
ncbi:hypothetical protein FRC00_009443 [Tulasnella sp. 408]|nr:hypothetical protein FRC00_009443 [Tulasnella sp. 408]